MEFWVMPFLDLVIALLAITVFIQAMYNRKMNRINQSLCKTIGGLVIRIHAQSEVITNLIEKGKKDE